jgi:hypothetical protein
MADSLGAKFLETSAKDRVNVDQIFIELTRALKKRCVVDITFSQYF